MLERPDVSLKWLAQAIALDPDYPEPHYLLGTGVPPPRPARRRRA